MRIQNSMLALISAACVIALGGVMPAAAQQYGFDSECRPLPPPGYTMMPQPPSPVCLERRAEMARQQEIVRQQQAEQVRQQMIDRRNGYERQRAAELSEDNHCREPQAARELMREWSGFKVATDNDLTAVDIEHLTTQMFDPTSFAMTCHGVLVISNGMHLIGTMQIRPNVAGDLIYQWKLDPSQDLHQFDEPPEPPTPPPLNNNAWIPPKYASPGLPGEQLSAAQGLADRRQLEAWRNSLSGDELVGANWWAGQRSLRQPGSCYDVPAGLTPAWTQGCLEAKQKLAPWDARRLSDPNYRMGWNSY